jgi:hypothetical protein
LRPLSRQVGPKTLYACVAIIVACVYAPSLSNAAIGDDYAQAIDNPYFTSLHGIAALFTNTLWQTTRLHLDQDFYRPLTMLSFAVNRAVGGDSPASLRAGNLLLAALNTGLFAAVVGRATGLPLLGAAVALLRGLDPIQTEAVAWISGRFDLLSVTFAVLGLWLVQRGRLRAAGLVLGAGVFAKEGVVLAVPLALLYAVWVEGIPLRRASSVAAWAGPLVVVYFVARAAVGARGASLLGARDVGRIVRHYARAVLVLGRSTVWPTDLDVFHHEHCPSLVVALLVIAGVAAGVASLWFAWRKARLRGMAFAFWGALAWATCLLPAALASSVLKVMAERYALLPNVGFFAILAGLIGAGLAKRPALTRGACAALVAAAVAGAVGTVQRIRDWKDQHTLYEASLRRNPDNPLALSSLGELDVQEGRYAEAEPLLARALAVSKRPWLALDALCFIRLKAGALDQAEDLCVRAVSIADDNDLGWMRLAQVRTLRQDWQGALAAADKAMRHIPTSDNFFCKAVALTNLHQESAARAVVDQALALDASHAGARRLAENLTARGF